MQRNFWLTPYLKILFYFLIKIDKKTTFFKLFSKQKSVALLRRHNNVISNSYPFYIAQKRYQKTPVAITYKKC